MTIFIQTILQQCYR